MCDRCQDGSRKTKNLRKGTHIAEISNEPSSPTVQCGPAAAVRTVFPRSQCITSPVSCSRLDCGTGPGLVRSRHRVQLRAWNHLAVFRHDWAVWLQLNRGPREEGRSQVGTLGWAGDAISKSRFQITKFPFKLSTNVAFSLPPADTKRPLHEYKAS